MPATSPAIENQLIEDMTSFSKDPYEWVSYAFEWGKGELRDCDGPEEWQAEILKQIRDGLITIRQAFQIAVASGHGIGKSTLVAWLILWSMSTFEDTRGVVTANTETQLRTKTWPELSKWHRLFIARHWFVLTATAVYSADPRHERTWRIDLVPWSETNTEAFAGLHNKGKRIILIFDEASAIADKIWEVSEGALTDQGTELFWLAFGNPTRNTGRFHDCFTRLRHRWINRQIDSRTVRLTDKSQIEKWQQDYGEDSDFFRVRVRGVFPKQEPDTLIPLDWLELAKERKVVAGGPVTLGVDVARFGDDDSVICVKHGRQIISIDYFHGNDTMTLAGRVAMKYREVKAENINIDEIGVGSGVVDRLSEQNFNVHGINVAEKAYDEERFVNLRSEMWWAARESLDPKNTVAMTILPDDRLIGDLSFMKWSVDSAGRIRIEPKEKTKERLGRSPDAGDAYALAVFESYRPYAKPVGYWAVSQGVSIPQTPDWA